DGTAGARQVRAQRATDRRDIDRRRWLGGTDRPYRFVGHHDGSGGTRQRRIELRQTLRRCCLDREWPLLANAQQRGESVAERRRCLGRDDPVVLTEDAPSFSVSDFDVVATYFAQLCTADFAGESSVVLPEQVLPPDAHRRGSEHSTRIEKVRIRR